MVRWQLRIFAGSRSTARLGVSAARKTREHRPCDEGDKKRRNRRDELLGLVAGNAASATWTLDCAAVPLATGIDLRGPYIQGPPSGRFIYLSWGTVDDNKHFTLFRRAKLWLDGVPADVMDSAGKLGMLVGRLGLTDGKGNPVCAAVRPPAIEWSAPVVLKRSEA